MKKNKKNKKLSTREIARYWSDRLRHQPYWERNIGLHRYVNEVIENM